MYTVTGSELVVIYPIPNLTPYEATPDGFPVVSPLIIPLNQLAINGGGGYLTQQIINSGATATASAVNAFIGFQSAFASTKTVNIPSSSGSLGIITISDLIGTAYDYPITPVPVSGVIINDPQVYTNFGSITLLDTNAGWISI